MDAEDRGGAAGRSEPHRRQQRPAEQGARVRSRDRPRRRRPVGITVSQIDNTLYDAFGQRQVSTIYVARNQYHVIMEVAPQYWQNPETLKDVYVSTSGGSVGGSQATNAVAGTVVASGKSTSANSANAQAARNLATNSIGATGKGSGLDRFGGQHQPGDHDSAVRGRAFHAGRDPARGQPPGPAGRQHHLVQPAAERVAQHGRRLDRGRP